MTTSTRFSARFRAFVLLGVLVLQPLSAAEVENLYQASVPVLSRDDAGERQRAFRAGLEEVLVKQTGRTDIGQQPLLAEALRNAQEYVESYAYRGVATALDPASAQPENTAQLLLETVFYRSQIQTLLENASMPLWPPHRPDTLLWVAVQEATGQRALAGVGGPGGDWVVRLRDVANRKGVPLISPVLDLEDRLALRPELLWSFDLEAVRRASARYQVESILAVRLYPLPGGQVFARSVHVFRDQVLELDALEVPAERFLEDSMAMVASELAAHYAILLSGISGGSAVQLVVSGVDSAQNYAGLLDYLGRLTVVQAVQVREVEGDRIVLELATGGQLRQLIEVLALDRRMLPLAQAERDNQQLNLQYQWQEN